MNAQLDMFEQWESVEPKKEVSITELEDLCVQISNQRAMYDLKRAEAQAENVKLEELENKLIQILKDAGKSGYDSNIGKFSITTFLTVVSKVANNLFSAKTSDLLNKFINVLLPTFVYPTKATLTI